MSKFIQYNESVVVTNRSCDEPLYNLIGKARASRLTTSIFVIYFQMTLVLPPHVRITDHVLPMDLQDIVVHVHLDIQALVVKVRYKSKLCHKRSS